jgi:hypothetical protein
MNEILDHLAAENSNESRPTDLSLPDRESGLIVGASRPTNEVTQVVLRPLTRNRTPLPPPAVTSFA